MSGQAPASQGGHTPAQLRIGNRRLLKLADILDVADALHRKRGEPGYDQTQIEHICGTPACAWSHWRSYRGKRGVTTHFYFDGFTSKHPSAPMEFAIHLLEAYELFDWNGCGKARTAKQAARYIRAFVKRRERALASAVQS